MKIPSLKEVVSAEEWAVRVDLAACYRLVAMHGWSDMIATHISARVPQAATAKHAHQFLINPYGLMFDEITASSLVKIDVDGHKLSESPFDVNRAGFVIHSAVHMGREDVACVLHTHTRSGVAVSAQRCGLLPISQQATLVLGSLGYHDYEGLAVHEDEQVRLQRDLGPHDHLMLRNHGLLTVGGTVADAFKRMYTLESACQIQVTAQAGGELIMVAPQVLAGVDDALARMQGQTSLGRLAWPALLRKLDRVNPGYDT
ncbi:class II aldolase/adducin family protein [Variovorax rhizosphaerae]|uniref:Class II aldolase/adducin family protein n=1 Tax=Variovorax rhizosphaerae TaxID=1836200 RepID=A0ABU8WYD8_9BURK